MSSQLLDLNSIDNSELPYNNEKNIKQFEKQVFVTQHTKYSRSLPIKTKEIGDKKLKTKLERERNRVELSSNTAARAEILLTSKTGKVDIIHQNKIVSTNIRSIKQTDIYNKLDIQTQRKMFSLKLDQFGPYFMDYSRDGKHLLLGGKKGHVALMKWQNFNLSFELNLGETIRDVKLLHGSMYATAQLNYVYIYDPNGVELHRLKNHNEPLKLEYLPYHYLLASVSKASYLKYTDVSIGELISEIPTKMGGTKVMVKNPSNAIINLGHSNGTVTMWSPNLTSPIVKMFCHTGGISSMAIDSGGYYLTTAGVDGQMKIWDIRTYQLLNSYYDKRPITSMSVSQKGMLAVAAGPHIKVWKDPFSSSEISPYLTHVLPGEEIQSVMFCPYEDILGFGHSSGFNSIVVPGAGEPNFDSFEVNPYATSKQLQEAEVHQLLDKLPAEMISLDPSKIGTLDTASKDIIRAEQKAGLNQEFNDAKSGSSIKSSKTLKRKQMDFDKKEVELRKESFMKSQKNKEMEATYLKNENILVSKSVLDRFKK